MKSEIFLDLYGIRLLSFFPNLWSYPDIRFNTTCFPAKCVLLEPVKVRFPLNYKGISELLQLHLMFHWCINILTDPLVLGIQQNVSTNSIDIMVIFVRGVNRKWQEDYIVQRFFHDLSHWSKVEGSRRKAWQNLVIFSQTCSSIKAHSPRVSEGIPIAF